MKEGRKVEDAYERTVIPFIKNKGNQQITVLTNGLRSEGHIWTQKPDFLTHHDDFANLGFMAMFREKFRDQRCIFVLYLQGRIAIMYELSILYIYTTL
jgi:hypothetical protein